MLKFLSGLFMGRMRVTQPRFALIEDHRVHKEPIFRRSRRRAYAAAYAADPVRFAPPRGPNNNPPKPQWSA